jgi:hypothetical protein
MSTSSEIAAVHARLRGEARWTALRRAASALPDAVRLPLVPGVIAALPVAAGVVMLVIAGHDVSWLAGVAAGAGGAIWTMLRLRATGDSVRDSVRDTVISSAQTSLSPARGLSAEDETAGALSSLPSAGWRITSLMPALYGTSCQVAVGPGGIILLESGRLPGVASSGAGAPAPRRRHERGPLAEFANARPRILGDAAALREELHALARRRTWVQSVFVIWSEFPAGCIVDGRCVFIHGPRLQWWLQRRPAQLEPAEVDDLFAALQTLVRGRTGNGAIAA